jgi:hypothetical protein
MLHVFTLLVLCPQVRYGIQQTPRYFNCTQLDITALSPAAGSGQLRRRVSCVVGTGYAF